MLVDEMVMTFRWAQAVVQLSKKFEEPRETQVGGKISVDLPRAGELLVLEVTKSIPKNVAGSFYVDILEVIDWNSITNAILHDIGFLEAIRLLESKGWSRRPGFINPY